MGSQKQRWAAKADRRNDWAASLDAKAAAITASQPEYANDWAFVSQPGHLLARARMIAQTDRAMVLRARAADHRAKAVELARMATTNAGDAEARRQSERDQFAAVKPGDTVQTILYGAREVVRVNRKTFSVRDSFGGTMTVDKAHCKGAV